MSKRNWKKPVNIFLVTTLVAGVVTPLASLTVKAETFAKDLIISEYIEGSSFNKAIEIYNGTGSVVDLSLYTLELYTNGAEVVDKTVNLSGILENGATYVIYHKDADPTIKAKGNLENSSVINFNGNDLIVLRKSAEIIDSIGQAGSSADFAKDITLVRKNSVLFGDTNISDTFDPALEWTASGINDFSNLGQHTMDTNVDPENPGPVDPTDPEIPSILSIGEARTKGIGEIVTIKGKVAAGLKNTFSVQDETGGIAVRPTSLAMTIGDEVTLTGKLADYRGLLQLDNAKIIEKIENTGAPNPKVVTGAQVSEENESQLVTVKNVTLTDVNQQPGYANFSANDGTNFIVRDETNTLELTKGTLYESITGIVQEFDKAYQVIPRSKGDIVADSSTLKPAIATPGSGTFIGKTSVILTTTTADAEIYYTVDGSDPTIESQKYETPIDITENTTLKAVVKAKNGALSEVTTFEYMITDKLQIHDIQGASHNSSFNDKTVEGIEGIVTYSFALAGNNYYTIQTPDEFVDDDPNTSEGILLYSGKKTWPVNVGDLVTVKGQVSEYAYDGYDDRHQTDLKTTQINVRDDQGGKVEVIKNSVALPEPIKIDKLKMSFSHIDSDNLQTFNPTVDAIDFWESIESMRVEVDDIKAVSPQEHGDLVTVLKEEQSNTIHGGIRYEEGNTNPNRIQFRLEPNGTARDFEVATGDTFNGPITGIVGYSYQNFKIYVPLDEMKAAYQQGSTSPEKTKIVKADNKLTIASYNLENFSNNRTSTTDDKARKLARAIGVDMESPDIVGVTEVQDNNGASAGDSKADQSYKRLIEAIKAAGGVEYQYVNIDPINNQDGGAPNANIRVGFLYNPDRVKLKEGIPTGDATTAVGYKNGQLTLNPGRIDPTNAAFNSSRKPLAAQFEFQGEDVVVIANHWNSKSGDTPLFGSIQPPQNGSELQRKKIAQIVYEFVKDIKENNKDANIVSLGDFNDYQFSEALKIHEGQIMTNMINKVDDSDRYTYVYQGNSQVLDHILVSNNLVNKTEIDILHINADFTDMAGRASDHDPVMVQIDLKNDSSVEPIQAEKVYYFKNFKTDKLTITKPSVAVHLDAQSVITKGIFFKSRYAELYGEGFKTTDVTINPEKAGAIIDLKGNAMKSITIDGSNVSEIRGADKIDIQSIKYVNGAAPEQIKFTNSKGDPIVDPSLPSENKQPIIKKPITNKTVTAGEEIQLDLTDYFSDPDGDELTFTSTKGIINGKNLTLNLLEGSHIVGVTASDGRSSVTTNFSVTVSTSNDYYAGALNKEGQALKSALHDIISKQKVLSYSNVWDAIKYTDEDPNNSSNVILFYSGKSSSKTNNGGNVGNWNREHTWAKSHGNFGTNNGPGTDIHHLRPTDVQVNSSRGNLDFDNGGSPVAGCNGCLKDSDSFEPPNRVKGDVARMLFYMATRYEEGDKVDLELNEKVNNGTAPFHGKLSVLLQWHKQDPVDEYEKQRNNRIYEVQGNRNPFIDHPEWVEMIWKSK